MDIAIPIEMDEASEGISPRAPLDREVGHLIKDRFPMNLDLSVQSPVLDYLVITFSIADPVVLKT